MCYASFSPVFVVILLKKIIIPFGHNTSLSFPLGSLGTERITLPGIVMKQFLPFL